MLVIQRQHHRAVDAVQVMQDGCAVPGCGAHGGYVARLAYADFKYEHSAWEKHARLCRTRYQRTIKKNFLKSL